VQVAKKSVKVVVVANPANTNALIALRHAPSLDPRNFSALTRLDQNRLTAQVAAKCGVSPDRVSGAVVWGNHSSTQVPDARRATILPPSSTLPVPVLEHLGGGAEAKAWLEEGVVEVVRTRGAKVIEARNASSAASAAHAVCDHVRDLWCGAGERIVSMAVISDDNPYSVRMGLVFSFPLTIRPGGHWSIVPDVPVDEWLATRLAATQAELEGEEADGIVVAAPKI
jgi:malate dehydrogenase